jgi:hypothetical protein
MADNGWRWRMTFHFMRRQEAMCDAEARVPNGTDWKMLLDFIKDLEHAHGTRAL